MMLTDNTRPGTGGGTTIIPNAEGVATIYDPVREKNLSISRTIITFGIDHKNIQGKRWMRLAGKVTSILTGFKTPRDANHTKKCCNFHRRFIIHG